MIGIRGAVCVIAAGAIASVVSGCGWHGLNSLPLPGTAGGGPDTFTIQAQMPDITNIQQNSRVRVGDVTVGTITKIERQDWHALVTMKLGGDVNLPENATATLGQTSLLGSLHVELAPPTNAPPKGRLHNGSLIPLSSGLTYPSTEQTLAAVSMLLNGGGLGQVQGITKALSTAFDGREDEFRSMMEQLDVFIGHVHDQTDEIIAATDSLNKLVKQFADQKPVVDKAFDTVPRALAVLDDHRDQLISAVDQLGKFSALAADSVNKTKDALVTELEQLGPVLESLANSGRALTRAGSFFAVYPFPKDTMADWIKGDYGNVSLILDMTLSRIDSGFFVGTRFEGDLTELEMQWGRTIGVTPSPYTAGNPLLAPYRLDQGP
ncbi:MCE family protein [Mycobacterium sp. 21AC1]|uniref:MCE family protein n=1 Tax=[Mycobacterium] appelbergii TaxID=2939269 RepID=UPI0029390A59|nr:MCE family protein [Mycobacterium sp. 21AC1]MDV3129934.1 MCE family protein [Mycobacterium sp. 21AC1]